MIGHVFLSKVPLQALQSTVLVANCFTVEGENFILLGFSKNCLKYMRESFIPPVFLIAIQVV